MPKFEVNYTDEEKEKINEDVTNQLAYENALQPDRAAEIVHDMAYLFREHSDDSDPVYRDAIQDSMNKLFKSRIAGSSIINDESWQDVSTFNTAVTEYVTDTKAKAGQKLEEYKEQIRNGTLQGTKDFYDNEDPEMENKVNTLAVNLFMQRDTDLYNELTGADLLNDMFDKSMKAHKYTKTVDTGNKTPDGRSILESRTKTCDEWLLEDTKKKQNDLFASKYKELGDKKESIIDLDHKNMESKDAYGFKMNNNYKGPNDKPFAEVPENRLAVKERLAKQKAKQDRDADEKQLGDYHAKLNKSMNDLEEYQRQALGVAAEAKKMLKELKSYKKAKGAENSDTYEELRKSLLSLSRLGTGRNMTPEELAMNVDPKKVERSLARVASASADYIKEHKGIFSGNGKVGINRQDLAVRAQTFAKLSRNRLDLDKFSITKEKLTVQAQRISSRLDQVEALNEERGYRKLPDRGMNTGEVSRILNSSINEANEADKDVHLGSGEYSDAVKAAKKVDAELKKFSEMAADPKNTGAVLEKQRKKLDKTIRTAEAAAKKYLQKKENESTPLSGMNHDERVQRRIDAIEDCRHAVKLARGNMNEIVHHLQSTRMSKADVKKQKQLDEDEALWQKLSKGSSFDPSTQKNEEQKEVQEQKKNEQTQNNSENNEQSSGQGSGDTAKIDAKRSADQPNVVNDQVIIDNIIRNGNNPANAQEGEEALDTEEEVRSREAYSSSVTAMANNAAEGSLRKQTAKAAENDLKTLENMTGRRQFEEFSQDRVLNCMASVVYNELVHSSSFKNDSASANSAYDQNKLKNTVSTIASSDEFKNIVGEINQKNVKKFLADPSRVKNEFIKAYREKEKVRDAQHRIEENSTDIKRSYTNDALNAKKPKNGPEKK